MVDLRVSGFRWRRLEQKQAPCRDQGIEITLGYAARHAEAARIGLRSTEQIVRGTPPATAARPTHPSVIADPAPRRDLRLGSRGLAA